ncbi:unnamed protein product [Bursaphelenchus xylophilus]|uniref:(pine wood nematode) hypothetical protein n=1 Tax=Bursaphelenchus xylophilus TaxID=6326 RepID=A0A811LVF5_BURXY|nr:unnamed protein product [Bursaphelenchus xylophilus]CAG9122447.1 unnamed protein product [Bursaphelenchus xylophilus]
MLFLLFVSVVVGDFVVDYIARERAVFFDIQLGDDTRTLKAQLDINRPYSVLLHKDCRAANCSHFEITDPYDPSTAKGEDTGKEFKDDKYNNNGTKGIWFKDTLKFRSMEFPVELGAAMSTARQVNWEYAGIIGLGPVNEDHDKRTSIVKKLMSKLSVQQIVIQEGPTNLVKNYAKEGDDREKGGSVTFGKYDSKSCGNFTFTDTIDHKSWRIKADFTIGNQEFSNKTIAFAIGGLGVAEEYIYNKYFHQRVDSDTDYPKISLKFGGKRLAITGEDYATFYKKLGQYVPMFLKAGPEYPYDFAFGSDFLQHYCLVLRSNKEFTKLEIGLAKNNGRPKGGKDKDKEGGAEEKDQTKSTNKNLSYFASQRAVLNIDFGRDKRTLQAQLDINRPYSVFLLKDCRECTADKYVKTYDPSLSGATELAKDFKNDMYSLEELEGRWYKDTVKCAGISFLTELIGVRAVETRLPWEYSGVIGLGPAQNTEQERSSIVKKLMTDDSMSTQQIIIQETWRALDKKHKKKEEETKKSRGSITLGREVNKERCGDFTYTNTANHKAWTLEADLTIGNKTFPKKNLAFTIGQNGVAEESIYNKFFAVTCNRDTDFPKISFQVAGTTFEMAGKEYAAYDKYSDQYKAKFSKKTAQFPYDFALGTEFLQHYCLGLQSNKLFTELRIGLAENKGKPEGGQEEGNWAEGKAEKKGKSKSAAAYSLSFAIVSFFVMLALS